MAAVKELSIKESLQALWKLQKIHSKIDDITILKGELPMEVSDLEDEIAGLHARRNRIEEEINGITEFIESKKVAIKEADDLAKKYDYVLFDTAPILAVTDALQLFKHAGTHLLVLSYGKHDLKEIEHTISKFEKGGVEVKGAVFNRIKIAHSYYGKNYKYNYKYNYDNKIKD